MSNNKSNLHHIRRIRQSLPAGFTSRDPAPTSHLMLIMLAELLRDLSRLGLGRGGIRLQSNPGIGGGFRHEELLLSFKIL